ncbi:OLC1v1027780C1 [Oldenlandia corymbosa var. corymbosa]|uniref:OLC1v1027780C1 n=1 Tax=Oldenlandia corymbosa var. corymbosa TaxID=529605 RepID=A0AAV1CBE5_OLDCO|nr:OLC1v1027780C1 [Oldenlandia corymbosa var. corymbosa]
MGRDLAYDCWYCDLLCAASSPGLYRINLEQGRFLSPLSTQSEALNVVTRSKVHGLVACGGEDGFVECFDVHTRSSVGRIDAVSPAGDVYDQEVTALQFDEDGGYLMGVGSSSGNVQIYDLRSSVPLRVKDHMYGNPILSIKWHKTLNSETTKLITADKHIDNSQIPSYFVPALGPAPKWCSHLDNLTEELEENPETTIYDDFKFLMKEDLEKLNLTSLVGSNCLRAYMHGYFIDYRLYKRVLGWSNSLDRKDYIEKLKQAKLEKERESRNTIRRKLPKVNRNLAAKLLLEEAEPRRRRGDSQLREDDENTDSDALTDAEDGLGGEKVAAMTKENVSNSNGVKVGAGGSRETSFISRSKAKYREYDDDDDDDDDDRDGLPQKRREIQALKLKPDKSSFRGGFGRGGIRGKGMGGRARGRGRGRHQ